MSGTLHLALDPEQDIILANSGGRVQIVQFVDYANRRARRVRDILLRASDLLGAQKTCLALRFCPPEKAGNSTDVAARAAISAFWQDQLAEMHEALFCAPEDDITVERVTALARTMGLDPDAFAADLTSERTEAVLARSQQSFEGSGVVQTPAIFIDGRAYEGAWDETSIFEAVSKPLGLRMHLASQDFFHWAASAGLVLVLATVAALVVVNVGFGAWYEHLLHTEFGLIFGDWNLTLGLAHWINDGLMALFFLLVGIEIKREIVNGELSSRDKAILPVLGALGGMMVPALLYVGLNWGNPETAHGWGIPMATDIAFTLGILALLGSRVPTSLKVFVSALAIADDLGAIVVIALFYGHGFHFDALLFALGILAVMAVLNLSRVYARLPYVLLGVLLWYFILQSGLHATLAGVLTAALIPSRPSANIEGVALHAGDVIARELDKGEIGAPAMARLANAVDRLREPGFHLQHRLEGWSNFLILPLFAFFNTGIALAAGLSFVAPEVLGVIVGLFIGKPLGICLFVWIGVKTGIARLSSDVSWRQLFGAASLCGVGFTMSIFIASAAFVEPALGGVKLAILIASLLSAVTGSLILLSAPRPQGNG
ncbi:Na+/H+ antiporter NhaA [Marinovum sp. 2_MG-2023]|uniref:Na+/H+ antiporter NhaA n=1 Tax=unclassified Marinovum TaxID=2647166 RepID=UPI0026E25950|nr:MULTISPECIES: Na+/H+ antiporter NhaA [unclassified Marinovum]MDO6731650.1 Na+/H+ antiporter NhaA [Marinovum sp. 2_MG-2023]MDO6778224.1 Na+/H+ antiporter NhaA [Marinovum sp. 1_MG-2023]